MLNRTTAPNIKDAIDFKLQLKPYLLFNLDNRVPVYAVDAGTQEVIQIELVFFAGNCYEGQNLVAKATNYMLKSGTRHKSAFQINEQFEYYGAYCNTSCNSEVATITLYTLNKYLDQLLPVLQEMITDAVFPEEELAIYQQNTRQKLSVDLKKIDFVADRLINAYVFGEKHPYGKYTTIESLDALNTTMLKDFFKTYYLQGKCLIFASGKLPANLQQQLNKTFGQISLASAEPKNLKTTPIYAQPINKYKQEIDATGVQGAIRIARPFPNRHHPDFMKVMILNNVFGGYFGSRLMNNIREDKGYTYGIYSYLQNRIQQSAWLISTEAGKDVCQAAIDEVHKEMMRLQNELIPKEELHVVRNYMMGLILGDVDGPFKIISRWKNIILNNLDEQFFYNSIQTIKNISAEELQELAKKYLTPADFYELIVT